MLDFLVGLAVGGTGTWALMKFVSPTVFRDKVTGEVTTIIHDGRTFVDAAARKIGL